MSADFRSFDVAYIVIWQVINLPWQRWANSICINTSLSSEMTLMLIVIRGAVYNGQNFVNYDDIWLFLRVAQIVTMHGHAMSYFNCDWISPCIASLWLVDASFYFWASRVYTLTSTSCTLLYVQPSTTF